MNESLICIGEGICIVKDIRHPRRDRGDVPVAEVLIEVRGSVEHFPHRGNGGNVPVSDIMIE